jgi:nucleotide-binding universal stress UspA family protein
MIVSNRNAQEKPALRARKETIMYKRILMAYNGSRDGRSALLSCRDLAAFTGADTHLLAVATMSSSVFIAEGMTPHNFLEDDRAHSQQVLDEGINLLKERGFTVTGHMAVGDPVEEICRLASDLKCDLIVVGHSRRTSFLAHWWRGSVGKYLIDHAPCGVLVIGTDD